MKKQSRLTALLLALCMLMSTLPVSALADGILTLEDYLSAVQRVQQELSEPSIPVEEENAYTLTRTTATETIVRETVTGELRSGRGCLSVADRRRRRLGEHRRGHRRCGHADLREGAERAVRRHGARSLRDDAGRPDRLQRGGDRHRR